MSGKRFRPWSDCDLRRLIWIYTQAYLPQYLVLVWYGTMLANQVFSLILETCPYYLNLLPWLSCFYLFNKVSTVAKNMPTLPGMSRGLWQQRERERERERERDRQTDRQTDGDGKDGWIRNKPSNSKRSPGRTDGWVGGWMSGWMRTWIGGRTDKWTDGRTGEQTSIRLDYWVLKDI